MRCSRCDAPRRDPEQEHPGVCVCGGYLLPEEAPVTIRVMDLPELQAELGRLRAAAEALTAERNALVLALSKLWPSHLMPHPAEDTDWEDDWRTLVCIHAPVGQLTWHLHDSEVPHFHHLVSTPNHWDGHTTEEKYARLRSLPPKAKWHLPGRGARHAGR